MNNDTTLDSAVARLRSVMARPWVQFVLLLAIAIILRCDTFGDPNLDDDDTFYYSVGAAMHHGALPYVDIWDRKPFGLFAIYYLIAALSTAAISYQLVATGFAAATAWTIARFGAIRGASAGGVLAGICYLLWLAPMQGFGGQTPIFYNLFIAAAMLLVVRAVPDLERGHIGRSACMAMLLAGCAITVKTTAVFEAAMCGVVAVWIAGYANRSAHSTIRHLLTYAAIGAAPSLLIALSYWGIGHFPEFWHGVVMSNLRKPPPDWFSMGVRALIMFAYLSPLLILAVFGLMEAEQRTRRLMLLWLLAAFVGLVSVPRFYAHYALPLLVPLCVAAIPFLSRTGIGLAATAIVTGVSMWLAPPFQFADAARSKRAIDELASTIVRHGGSGPLLVYDGPPQLHQLTGKPLVTPLTFYAHLSDQAERDVSHLSTLGEVRRVVSLAPGAIVMTNPIRSAPVNQETYAIVRSYVTTRCHLVNTVTTYERLRSYQVEVWGDCAAPGR